MEVLQGHIRLFELCDKFDNYYYLIERNHSYENKGRYQTEEESNSVSKEIKLMLDKLNIKYSSYQSGENSVNEILQEVKRLVNVN